MPSILWASLKCLYETSPTRYNAISRFKWTLKIFEPKFKPSVTILPLRSLTYSLRSPLSPSRCSLAGVKGRASPPTPAPRPRAEPRRRHPPPRRSLPQAKASPPAPPRAGPCSPRRWICGRCSWPSGCSSPGEGGPSQAARPRQAVVARPRVTRPAAPPCVTPGYG